MLAGYLRGTLNIFTGKLEAILCTMKLQMDLSLFFFSFSEYLAVFKKTVSSHEIFLQRISSHPVLSKDHNFCVFLEYDQDVRHFLLNM